MIDFTVNNKSNQNVVVQFENLKKRTLDHFRIWQFHISTHSPLFSKSKKHRCLYQGVVDFSVASSHMMRTLAPQIFLKMKEGKKE